MKYSERNKGNKKEWERKHRKHLKHKRSKIYIIRVPEEEKIKVKGIENFFIEIIGENFPHLGEDRHLGTEGIQTTN